MTIILILSFIFIGITAIILQAKPDRDFGDFLNLLVFVALSSVLVTEVGDENRGIVYALMGIGAINFVISQVAFIRKPGIRVLVPLLSMMAFFMIFKEDTLSFTGKNYPMVNKFLVIGTVISVVGYELGKLKLSLISKLFGELDEVGLMKTLLLFITGLAVFLGVFQSGMFGLLVLTAAFMSSSFYREHGGKNISIALLSLSIVPFLLAQSDYTSVDLMSGDVLAGIFFGAFGVYFLQKLWAAKKPKFVLIGIGYFIVLGLAFVLLYNHMTHENMGGMDAFIGVIVGAALTMAIIGEGYVGASLIAFLFIGGVMIPPYMVNIEEAAFENDRIVIDDNSDAQGDVEFISLDEVIGNYKVDETISNISFVLGQEGETKGAFKSYSGEISINEFLEESTFEILLKLDDLTTFNAMRDGSLMSEDYFDAENFPTMKYSGSTVEVVGENDYKIHGEFTMLGISKEIAVSLRCVETDNGKVLIGKGEIDRTLFGMPPSAEEGDVVSFDYTLGLVNN